MGKGTFFTGQPIFNQILSFIPRLLIARIARETRSDRYCKSLKTYDHLVTMLYATFNRCNSLREVTTGMLAWEHRIQHLGLNSHPRRSTLSDANARRSEQVFEKIYLGLLKQYSPILPDSRRHSKKNNLYIFDSTSIALFQETLKGSGLRRCDGKNKGGIKVHTLLNSGQDVPVMIRYSPAADSDVRFLKEVNLCAGSVVVFDRGYCDYRTYNRFTKDKVTFVTRNRSRSVYQIEERKEISADQAADGILSDWNITLGYTYLKKAVQVRARLVRFKDPATQKEFEFITNNRRLKAISVANYYRQRWQIETFFKRIKQNYALQYFLGDNTNSIKIQIWCALIADLILKVVRHGSKTRMAFSNLTGLIRLHMMTYMDLNAFLKWPEKSLLNKLRRQTTINKSPYLFKT
jgi:hypothetical protein